MSTTFEQPVTLHRPAARAALAGAQRWSVEAVQALFELPFNDLLYRAQTVHRENFDPTEVELSTLLSIKTGGCPEDCGYCPQAARYDTGVEASKLMELDEVLAGRAAREGRTARRASAWAPPGARPKDRDIEKVAELVRDGEGAGPGNLRHAGHARATARPKR